MITKIADGVCIDPESVIALKRTMKYTYNRLYGLEIYMKNSNIIVLENVYTSEKIDEMVNKILGGVNNELK